MSYARDDAGFLNAIDALETRFIKTGAIAKTNYAPEKTSGSEASEPEFNDVYIKSSENVDSNKELEKIQEDYNNLEIKNEKLQKISSDLEEISRALSENQSSKENKKTESGTESTSANPEAQQKKEEAMNKIQELMSKVGEKQSQIAELQQEIQQTVTSLVEIKVGENADSIEQEVQLAKELKQNIVDEVKKDPEKVKKIQIKNLDKNLLLAMINM